MDQKANSNKQAEYSPFPKALSCSSVSTHTSCPALYVYSRFMPERRTVHWKALIGSAVDRVINWYYQGESKGNITACISLAETTFADFIPSDDSGQAVIVPPDGREIFDWFTEHVEDAIDLWEREIGMHTNVVQVQPELRHTWVQVDSVTGDVLRMEFIGYPDLIAKTEDGHLYIIDNKTSGKSGGWKENDLAEQYQHVAYNMLARAMGMEVTHHEYHIIRFANGNKPLAKPQVSKLPVHPSSDMRSGFLKMLFARYREMTYNLTKGYGPPQYGWKCKDCTFRAECQRDWGTTPPS